MPLDLDRPSTPLARLLLLAERRVPLRFAAAVAQARRDVAVVEGLLLRGEKPSSLVERRGASHARGARVEAPLVSQQAASVPVAEAPQPVASPASVASAPAPGPRAGSAVHGAKVTLLDESGRHEFEVQSGRYLLESALEAGANIPFSCTLGGCGTCKVRLLEGEMELEEPNCLTPEELAEGYRLCCVGRVVSDTCTVRREKDLDA